MPKRLFQVTRAGAPGFVSRLLRRARLGGGSSGSGENRPAASAPAAPARAVAAPEPLESRVLLSSYFVSTAGNDAHAGSASAPFRTIQRAADVAQPGDTVFVRGGTYRETVTPRRSGTS